MCFDQCILPRSPTHVLRGMRLSQVPQSLSVASHGLSQQGLRGLMLLLPLRTHYVEVHRMVSAWTSFCFQGGEGLAGDGSAHLVSSPSSPLSSQNSVYPHPPASFQGCSYSLLQLYFLWKNSSCWETDSASWKLRSPVCNEDVQRLWNYILSRWFPLRSPLWVFCSHMFPCFSWSNCMIHGQVMNAHTFP